jgi:hypothetical protein
VENVAFHATCAEAERAGFRPCKRCRPDEAPLAERNAALVAEGTLTAAEIVERGRVAFPTVWRRIEAAGGVRLPGVAHGARIG